MFELESHDAIFLASGARVNRPLELAGQDAADVRPGLEFLICSSFSKNFALYNERVGALTIVAADSTRAASASLRARSSSAGSGPATSGAAGLVSGRGSGTCSGCAGLCVCALSVIESHLVGLRPAG